MRGGQLIGGTVGMVLSTAMAAPAVGQAPTYRAELITPGLSAISAAAMNEAGDVVGTGTTGSGGWVARAGTSAMLLPLPAGRTHCFANDINDAGIIVGSVSTTSAPGFGTAAAWTPDGAGGYTVVVLGTLPGHVTSEALGVNNLGDVVGYSSNGTYRYPVLFSLVAPPQDLSATGIFDPADVNDQRMVVDESFTVKRLDLNTMVAVDLGIPPGPPTFMATRSSAINESNQVAGLAISASNPNCDRYAARYTEGAGWQVLSSCGSSNGAYDINDRGDLVMRLNIAPYVRLEGIGTFLIENLIESEVGHWYVINGFGLTINNARQMAVPATNDVTGEGGVVLLTPVAAPGDLDGDGLVNIADLLALLGAWGPCPAPCPPACGADLDEDCQVGITDLLLLLANWS